MIALFKMLGSGVLRIGGSSVDSTGWNNTTCSNGFTCPVNINRLSGFLQACNWTVIYGLNFVNSTPAIATAEAVVAAGILGDLLIGFELGNEINLYPGTQQDVFAQWQAIHDAVKTALPNASIVGADVTGSYSYTSSFARQYHSNITLLTQHYYRASALSNTSTLDLLLAPDPYLLNKVLPTLQNLTTSINISAYRMTEVNSFSSGGLQGVSNSFGAAIWAIQLMSKFVQFGAQGVNFHNTGSRYTAITTNYHLVTGVLPLYYGIYLFSMLGTGEMMDASQSASGLQMLTTVVVKQSSGKYAILLANNDRALNATVQINSLTGMQSASVTTLTAPQWNYFWRHQFKSEWRLVRHSK